MFTLIYLTDRTSSHVGLLDLKLLLMWILMIFFAEVQFFLFCFFKDSDCISFAGQSRMPVNMLPKKRSEKTINDAVNIKG